MGDTIDGSSSAAQSAPLEEKPSDRNGFLTRLFYGNKEAELTSDSDTKDIGSSHFQNLNNLRNLRVEDVVVPRAGITAVPNDLGVTELVKVFRNSGYSRLPVYSDTLDSPLGLIHLKDLALKYGFNGKSAKFNLKNQLRELLFVPPSMPIGVLLQKMQTERKHMALVIDEYGGVDGLVTIEDLIEQVVGEIADEHDIDEGQPWIEEAPGVFLFQAQTALEEVHEVLKVDLIEDYQDEEIDTLGGLVFMLTGRVPTRGEVIKHPKGFEFEIIDADPRRIKRLRVCVPAKTG